MYHYIKERGYAIYPGKVTDADTFRIGNIGEIYEDDIIKLYGIIKEFLEAEKPGDMTWRDSKMALFDAVIFDWAGTTVDYGALPRYRHLQTRLGNMESGPPWTRYGGPWEC